MSEEELIEVLRQFDEKRVEELPEKTRNIFYAIMKIADERDRLNNIINQIKEYLKYQVENLDFEKDTKAKMLGSMILVMLDKEELKENNNE